MKAPSFLRTDLLVAAAAMLLVFLGARWAIEQLSPSGALALTGAALAASIAGAFVLSRAAPPSASASVSSLAAALRALRRGDHAARAPVADASPLAPIALAINELADDLSNGADGKRKEADLLAGILDGMAEGVIVFDRSGHIVLANLAARRIAVSGDDVIGKSAIEALRNAALAEAVDRALRKGEGGVREVQLGRTVQRRLIVRISQRSGKEDSGGVIAVLHDVTDLRRLEAIRTEFVANVSHELRTPVTAITTAAETLLGGALDDRNDAAEFVEIIDRNARRLRTLVEDLLDLSKIESRAYKLAPESHPLRPILLHVKKLVVDAATRRRVQVAVEAPEDLTAWIDRHAFEQVLANLLDNAVKYAGDGASVTVHATGDDEAVIVTVSDTGAGIAPHHLERLFERFYRVDAGRSREVGGTGLGLAIVKHLVEAMGGRISVESALGRGTTFTIRLPATPISPREPGATDLAGVDATGLA